MLKKSTWNTVYLVWCEIVFQFIYPLRAALTILFNKLDTLRD